MKRQLIILTVILISYSIGFYGQSPGGVPTTNLVSWQNPDGINSGVINNGDPVTTWDDQSGNGNGYGDHGSSTERPTIVVGDANGFDVVQFDGSNDYLIGTGVSYQARTVFVVFKASSSLQSTSDLGQIWGHYTSGVQLSLEARQGSTRPYSVDGNGSSEGKVSINGEKYGTSGENPPSPTQWEYDEYMIATLELSGLSSNLTTHIIGDLISPANHNFGGQIAEIIVYSSTLSDSFEKLRVNNYLGKKYGLSLTYNTDNSLYTDATYNQQLLVVGNHNGTNYDDIAGDGGAGYLELNTGSFGIDERVWLAHSGITHGLSNADVSGSSRWKRIYRLQRDNPSGTLTSVDISFGTQDAGFGDNDIDGRTIADYKLFYRAGTSGAFSEVTGAVGALDGDQNKVTYTVNNADLQTGYYTLGIPGGNVWYSYLVSGTWDDPDMWTLDPSGTLYINSGAVTPSGSDEVVILNGKTVTDVTGAKTAAILTLKAGGVLDIEDHTGYSFSTINGAGTIRLKADNFPTSTNLLDFAAKGKVEFYGDSYSVLNDYTFFNVDVNLSNSSDVLTFGSNLTVNGTLIIESGEMRIGNSTTDTRIIDVNGDLLVQPNGSINVDQAYSGANVVHRLEIAGDFTNEGVCVLSDAGGYDPTGSLVDVQVDVRFNNSVADQKVYLDGTTDFYRIVSDKGVDANYLLDIEATAVSNFNLYGKNNGGGSTGGTGENDNALGLKSGTVKLSNNIIISELKSGSGNYDVPEGCVLWVSNADVTMTGATALVAYGGVKVSGPLAKLNVYSGSGITLRNFGFIEVLDGVVNLNQVRRSTNSGIHLGAYKQSGGYVTVADFGFQSPSGSFSLFDLAEESHTFEMTGGTLHIIEDNGGGNDGTDGAFFVNSNPEYFNVTGGTIIFESERSTASTLTIATRVDLPNVIFRNNTGNLIQFQTKGTTGYNHPSDLPNIIPDSAFTVVGDLTIETADINFDHNGGDVVLYGDFNVAQGSGIEYDLAKQNTFMFAGSGNRKVNFEHLAGSAYQNFYRVDVNMSLETDTLFLYGSNKDTTNNSDASMDNDLLRVNKSFYLREGVFDNRNFSVTLKCDSIVNTGVTLGDRRGGGSNTPTNPNSNNDRIRIMDFDNSGSLIYMYQDNQARWGTVDLDTDNDYVDLNHDMNRFDRFYFKSGRVNMKNFRVSLPIVEAFNARAIAGGYSSEDMFVAGGSASDDGFSKSWGSNAGTFLYPIGLGLNADARYTPITVTVTSGGSNNRAHYAVLVDEVLPTSEPTGSDILSMYWKMEMGWNGSEGSLPTVNIDCVYDDLDVDGGDEATYVGGKVLDVVPFTRTSPGIVTTASNLITYTGISVDENASYTAGNVDRFIGAPDVYYSYGPGGTSVANRLTWSDPNSWSNVGHYDGAGAAVDYPDNGAVVYIAFNPTTDLAGTNGVHYMDLDVDVDVSLVYLEHRTVKDDLGNDYTESNTGTPRLTIQSTVNTADLGFVNSAQGEIVLEVNCSTCDPDPNVTVLDIPEILGDFATFAGGGNSDWNTFEFNLVMPANTVGYLPTTLPTIYPRLDINANDVGGQAIIFTEDLDVRSRLRFYNDANIWMNDGANGDITVERGIRFFGGNDDSYIKFQDKGSARTITCNEIFTMQSANHRVFVDETDMAGLEHRFIWGATTRNDRYMNLDDGYLDFHSDNVNGSQVIFDIQNIDTSIVYGKETTLSEFHKIEVNTADTTFVRFQTNFLLSGDANGTSASKPFLLNSGHVILEDSDLDITVSSGGGEFKLPENVELELAAGKMNINGNSDLRLDGKLTITGGSLDMASDGNINNLQYTVGTGSVVSISDGELLIGGHFMRQSDDDQAAINFVQSGGTSRFGIHGSEYSDRGIFEVLGSNSSYNRSGGSMNIESGNGSTSVAGLLITNPGTFSESGSSTIVIGGGVNAGAIIGINCTEEINTLELSGLGDNPVANMLINTLQIQNLIIGSGSVLQGNDLGVYVSDTWTNNAGLTGFDAGSGNTGTTYCIASRVDISGDTEFNHFTNSCSDRVVLGLNTELFCNDLRNTNDLYINDNLFHVQGDVVNNDWIRSNVGSLIMDGDDVQYMSSEGVGSTTNCLIQKLSIDNDLGVQLLEYNGKPLYFHIYVDLNLINGVLTIGDNYLNIYTSTTITGSDFSKTKMIRTNGRSSSLGVRVTFGAGNSFNQILPIGVSDKYTPLDVDLVNNGTGSALALFRAIDDQPASTIPTSYSQNLLNFYWRVYFINLSGMEFNGNFKFYYNQNDVNGDEGNYGSAKLEETNWILQVPEDYDPGPPEVIGGPLSADVDTLNNTVSFSVISKTSNGTIDYTCGDTKTTLPKRAYPLRLPKYVSRQTGAWNDNLSWIKDGDVNDNEVPTIGSQVEVQDGHEITFDQDLINVYNLQINGKVKVNNTIKHNLGIVNGNGIIEMNSGQFPGGSYDEFLTTSGGVVEYAGTGTYQTSSRVTAVRGLIFSGTGTRQIPLIGTAIGDSILIDGVEVDNTINNSSFDLEGDIAIRNGGTFLSGTGGVNFIGDKDGHIKTSMTGVNQLAQMTIYKTSGDLYLDGAEVFVKNSIDFQKGRIIPGGNKLLMDKNLSYITQPWDSSYVQGVACKELTGADFKFPVGDKYKYAYAEVHTPSAGEWCSRYYYNDPSSDGYFTTSIKPETPQVQDVNSYGYWDVEGPVGAVANGGVSLFWSYVTIPNPYPNPSDAVFVEWDATNSEWYGKGGTYNNTTKKITSDPGVTFSKKQFTFGSLSVPLPVELIAFDVKLKDGYVALDWVTVSELNNSGFEIERSYDLETFEKIGFVDGNGTTSNEHEYLFYDDNFSSGTIYYRLKQIDYNGDFEYSKVVSITVLNVISDNNFEMIVYPNPSSEGDELTFKFANYGEQVSVMIYDLTGGVILSSSDLLLDDQGRVTMSLSLNQGVYIVKTVSDNQTLYTKLLVE